MTHGERPSSAAEEGAAWSATAALWDEHWAAAPRRRDDGSYRFHNTFRWLLAAA